MKIQEKVIKKKVYKIVSGGVFIYGNENSSIQS